MPLCCDLAFHSLNLGRVSPGRALSQQEPSAWSLLCHVRGAGEWGWQPKFDSLWKRHLLCSDREGGCHWFSNKRLADFLWYTQQIIKMIIHTQNKFLICPSFQKSPHLDFSESVELLKPDRLSSPDTPHPLHLQRLSSLPPTPTPFSLASSSNLKYFASLSAFQSISNSLP